jgi:hypothetical protein
MDAGQEAERGRRLLVPSQILAYSVLLSDLQPSRHLKYTAMIAETNVDDSHGPPLMAA